MKIWSISPGNSVAIARRSTGLLRAFCLVLIAALAILFWITTQRYNDLKNSVTEDSLWAITRLDRDMRKLSSLLDTAVISGRETYETVALRYDIVYSQVRVLRGEAYRDYFASNSGSNVLIIDIDEKITSLVTVFDAMAASKQIEQNDLISASKELKRLLEKTEVLISLAGNNIAKSVSEARNGLLRLQITSAVIAAVLVVFVVALMTLQTVQLRDVQRAKIDVEALAANLQKKVAEGVRDIREREEEIIERLSIATGFKDSETEHHTRRVAAYSEAISRSYGLDDETSHDIRLASLMHDIGKVGIADSILLKAGPLTPAEFETMKGHTTIGANILGGSNAALLKLASKIAQSHHERWDGLGYPLGLKGDALPLSARIVALADNFDALTTERPYKSAWSLKDAISYISNQSGVQFDPTCVDAFLRALPTIEEIYNGNQEPIAVPQ